MIDRDLVKKVAALAQLAPEPGHLDVLGRELAQIIEYVDRLSELDTTSVPPLTHLTDAVVDRPDVPVPSLTPDQALANAPDRHQDFFRVPRVLGDA